MKVWQGMGHCNFEGNKSGTLYSVSLKHSKSSKQPVPKLCSKKPEYLHYRLDSLGFESWQDQEIFLFSKMQNVQIDFGSHPASIQRVLGFSSLPEHKVNHSPWSSVKFKNEWCYTSSLFHGVDREKFTFSKILQCGYSYILKGGSKLL